MSTLALPTPFAAPPAPLPAPAVEYYRISVAQYHAMIQADILTPNDRVELLEGYLVTRMPTKTTHAGVCDLVAGVLRAVVPGNCLVREAKPLTLGDSEPEPDVVISLATARDHLRAHGTPATTPLVIEVADTSLAFDRATKTRVYGRAGIATYWIVNVVDGQLEVYTNPSGPVEPEGYRQRQDLTPGMQVPVVIDGVEVARLNVADLLP